MRFPWPWEEEPYPELPSRDCLTESAAAAVALHFPDSLPGPRPVAAASEHHGGASARDTRAQMERDIREQMTDGSPAAREWATQKARNALERWDRGVTEGNIQYVTR